MDAREQFIRRWLADPERFGREDIEEWLTGQAKAERPDCSHSVAESDGSCVWCLIGTHDILQIAEMSNARKILEGLLTPVDAREYMPRVGFPEELYPLFGFGTSDPKFYVGHNRFLVARPTRGDVIYSMDPRDKDVEASMRPFELNIAVTSAALSDLLMGEWARRAPHADEARSLLVIAVHRHVQSERIRAGNVFDRLSS